jgi:hypothetical protein
MNLRPRDRVALAVVLAFALVGAFYVLVLKPEQKKASTLSAAIVGQRRALTTAQANYAAGRAAQASIKADAAEWAALRKAVPNTSDIPALLRVLERNANAVHVRMQAIALSGSSGSASGTSPSPSTTTPSTGGTATGGAAGSGATAPTSVALSLTFAGGYTALHNLVQRLDGLVVISGNKVHATGPLLSISSVSLTGSPKLTVQLTATIYQLAAPTPATAATAATTGGQS